MIATARFWIGAEKYIRLIRPDYEITTDGTMIHQRESLDTAHISLEETAAFGDDENDLDMLQACGKGIAVANALESVRNAADEICGDNDSDGVAIWLKENVIVS